MMNTNKTPPSPSGYRPPSARQGFTLIELLTVIAIIGILATILIPVAASVRRQAHAALCASNLRQIGNATFLYLNDHNDRFFPKVGGSRFNSLGKIGTRRSLAADQRPLNPYLDVRGPEDPVEVARCPADAGSEITVGGSSQDVDSAYDAFGSSLNPNHWDIGLIDGNQDPVHYSEIIDPTRFVMFAEDPALVRVFANNDKVRWHWEGEPRFNLLFGDGHVAPHIVKAGERHAEAYSFYRDPPTSAAPPTR